MYNNFDKDLELSLQLQEECVLKLIDFYRSYGFYVRHLVDNNDDTFDFALLVSNDLCSYVRGFGWRMFYEFKVDFKSVVTGNIFFEYKCRGRYSGIMTTLADYYLITLPHPKNFTRLVLLLVQVRDILTYLKNNKLPIVNGGDDNQSKGLLVSVHDFFKKVDYYRVGDYISPTLSQNKKEFLKKIAS